MFYDELELDDESHTPGTPGAPILEEEEEEGGGRGTRDLRNLLERKRKKRSSALQDPESVWWCENSKEG